MSNPHIHALFPKLVYTVQLDKAEKYNQIFSNLYDKYGFETTPFMTQGEFAGKADMQMEPDLVEFMNDVILNVKQYLSVFALRTDYFDYYVTKTCFAILDKAQDSIGAHYHPASDVSFVYYVQAPDSASPLQIINESANKTLDGLLGSWRPLDRSLIHGINEFNCQTFMIKPQSGMLVLFLGEMLHMVGQHDPNHFDGRRLSVAGDVNLVLKSKYNSYESGKPSLDKWVKFKGGK